MNMKIGRKQVILGTLVIALGAAVILTWKLSGAPAANSTGTSSASGAHSQTAGTGAAGDDYFAAARLTREQTEAQADDLLNTVVSGTLMTSAEQQSAKSEIKTLTDNFTVEGTIESSVKEKGFTDCMAFINDGTVRLVVKPKGNTLSADDVAQVEDIVIQQAKVSADHIIIMQPE